MPDSPGNPASEAHRNVVENMPQLLEEAANQARFRQWLQDAVRGGSGGSPPRDISRQDIAQEAYRIWESKGRQHGQDRENWLAAIDNLTRAGLQAQRDIVAEARRATREVPTSSRGGGGGRKPPVETAAAAPGPDDEERKRILEESRQRQEAMMADIRAQREASAAKKSEEQAKKAEINKILEEKARIAKEVIASAKNVEAQVAGQEPTAKADPLREDILNLGSGPDYSTPVDTRTADELRAAEHKRSLRKKYKSAAAVETILADEQAKKEAAEQKKQEAEARRAKREQDRLDKEDTVSNATVGKWLAAQDRREKKERDRVAREDKAAYSDPMVAQQQEYKKEVARVREEDERRAAKSHELSAAIGRQRAEKEEQLNRQIDKTKHAFHLFGQSLASFSPGGMLSSLGSLAGPAGLAIAGVVGTLATTFFSQLRREQADMARGQTILNPILSQEVQNRNTLVEMARTRREGGTAADIARSRSEQLQQQATNLGMSRMSDPRSAAGFWLNPRATAAGLRAVGEAWWTHPFGSDLERRRVADASLANYYEEQIRARGGTPRPYQPDRGPLPGLQAEILGGPGQGSGALQYLNQIQVARLQTQTSELEIMIEQMKEINENLVGLRGDTRDRGWSP